MHVLFALLAFQQAAAPAAPVSSAASDTAHVVIVATTDVHGRVLGWDYVRDAAAPGGLSRAATVVETLRAQYPDQVVLVDAGDLIEGNLFAAYFAERDSQRPHPVVDALNAMQRSEEHTSELQSQSNLVCRLLLEKKQNFIST